MQEVELVDPVPPIPVEQLLAEAQEHSLAREAKPPKRLRPPELR